MYSHSGHSKQPNDTEKREVNRSRMVGENRKGRRTKGMGALRGFLNRSRKLWGYIHIKESGGIQGGLRGRWKMELAITMTGNDAAAVATTIFQALPNVAMEICIFNLCVCVWVLCVYDSMCMCLSVCGEYVLLLISSHSSF